MKICFTEDLQEAELSHNPKIKKKIFISKDEIKSITNFSRAVFPPGETAYAHSHNDMTEVFYIESGHGTITIDGKHLQMKPGTCIIAEPNETHELKNTGATDLVILYFGVNT